MSRNQAKKIHIASPVHLLHRAGQCADDLFSSSVEDAQLTPRQFTVLKCVAAAEGASQTYLVEATGIDRSTLADIVRRLVERGLLARERTRQDARTYAVRVTTAGAEILGRTTPVTEASERKLLNAVAPEDREAFMRSLRRIVDTFGPVSSARVVSRVDRGFAQDDGAAMSPCADDL